MYHRGLSMLAGAAAAAALLGGCASNPATGDTDWVVMTQGREISIGEEMHQQIMAEGASYDDPELQVASLDHAIWFHGDFRADQWLLQHAELERNSGGRTLVRGRFYTREGHHVATVMQQGLMRLR